MFKVDNGDPELIGFNPFAPHTVVNPITLEKNNISFVVIVQFNNLLYNAIISLVSYYDIIIITPLKHVDSATRATPLFWTDLPTS